MGRAVANGMATHEDLVFPGLAVAGPVGVYFLTALRSGDHDALAGVALGTFLTTTIVGAHWLVGRIRRGLAEREYSLIKLAYELAAASSGEPRYCVEARMRALSNPTRQQTIRLMSNGVSALMSMKPADHDVVADMRRSAAMVRDVQRKPDQYRLDRQHRGADLAKVPATTPAGAGELPSS